MQLIKEKNKKLILDNNDLEKERGITSYQKMFLFNIKDIQLILLTHQVT